MGFCLYWSGHLSICWKTVLRTSEENVIPIQRSSWSNVFLVVNAAAAHKVATPLKATCATAFLFFRLARVGCISSHGPTACSWYVWSNRRQPLWALQVVAVVMGAVNVCVCWIRGIVVPWDSPSWNWRSSGGIVSHSRNSFLLSCSCYSLWFKRQIQQA